MHFVPFLFAAAAAFTTGGAHVRNQPPPPPPLATAATTTTKTTTRPKQHTIRHYPTNNNNNGHNFGGKGTRGTGLGHQLIKAATQFVRHGCTGVGVYFGAKHVGNKVEHVGNKVESGAIYLGRFLASAGFWAVGAFLIKDNANTFQKCLGGLSMLIALLLLFPLLLSRVAF